MKYEEADIAKPGEGEEAEIVRDFSELPDNREPRNRRQIIIRASAVFFLLLLAFLLFRGCSAGKNTPESDLQSTKERAAANLIQAEQSLLALAPPAGTPAASLAVELEAAAGVPIGLGRANEPGEVGVRIKGRQVILDAETERGRRLVTYRMP